MEGWDDPDMQADLNALDAQIGLPDTTVETVYPERPATGDLPGRDAGAGLLRFVFGLAG